MIGNDMESNNKKSKRYLILSIVSFYIAIIPFSVLVSIGILVVIFGSIFGAYDTVTNGFFSFVFGQNGELLVLYILFIILAIVFWKKHKRLKENNNE